jgi:hypothetical protein
MVLKVFDGTITGDLKNVIRCHSRVYRGKCRGTFFKVDEARKVVTLEEEVWLRRG